MNVDEKKILSFVVSLFVGLFALPVAVSAEYGAPPVQQLFLSEQQEAMFWVLITGWHWFRFKDVRKTASIINVALGLLGIVAVIIILIGGFEWMTAGGNEEKQAGAQQNFAGIIGLAIILSICHRSVCD